MKVVFLGSGSFAVPSLEALVAAGHEVMAVVTQPDRERGRGRAVAPPPVKPVAERLGLPVLQPSRVKAPEVVERLRGFAPELQVVVAYGQILSRAVIDAAARGTVNVHASLLPAYRGAAPIQWAIARGERETGVTTMAIDEGLDTGPILLQRALPIEPTDTAGSLEPRLAALGAGLLLETVDGLREGRIRPVPQDHDRATLAPLLRKEDGRIDWSHPAEAIGHRVRGFTPWPGTATAIGGRTLRVLRVEVEPAGAGSATPGTLLRVDRGALVVACGTGTALRLLEVQPENRKAMSGAAFAAGARLAPDARFTS